MTTQINAATRLKAALSNKLKNEVMRALTSKNITVDRQGDMTFMAHADLNKVTAALGVEGWERNDNYKEFEKDGEDYTLALTASGSAVKLEFTYMG